MCVWNGNDEHLMQHCTDCPCERQCNIEWIRDTPDCSSPSMAMTL